MASTSGYTGGNLESPPTMETTREHINALKQRTKSFGTFASDMAGIFRTRSAPSSIAQSGRGQGSSGEVRGMSETKVTQCSNLSHILWRWLPSAGTTRQRTIVWLLVWACIILAVMLGLSLTSRQTGQVVRTGGLAAAVPETLVLYVFSNSDSEYEQNLRYFLEHGMWEGDGCHYLIIVQQGEGVAEGTPFPVLPFNARMVFHDNRCFDWGTFGWALTAGIQNVAAYKHIIFMNSSVRGPFLPPYWPASVHWSRILTSRLVGNVKLVGSTISCEPIFRNGDPGQETRKTPHVQSYMVATDQVGLKVLLEDRNVFKCFDSIHDTIWHSEVGSSLAVLSANYTIDSLMLRYQGVDWRDPRNAGCNAMKNPYAEYAYDGLPLNPMEVVFVKVKAFMLDARWLAQHAAARYDSWLQRQAAGGGVDTNDYASFQQRYRLGRMFTMQLRGSSCFDHRYYRDHCKDLRGLSDRDTWRHFVEHGQFEGRLFRFSCSDRMAQAGVTAAAVQKVLDNPMELPSDEAAEIDLDVKEIGDMQQEEMRAIHRHIAERLEAGKQLIAEKLRSNRQF